VPACTTDRQWGRIIGDGELALSGVTVQVKRLFDIGGFSDVFLIFATQAEWNPQAANVTNIASRP
jgi:anti-anti-sigma regulatory factor